MTPLASAILDILTSAESSTIRSDSLPRILFHAGFDSGGEMLSVGQIDVALDELVAAGLTERTWRWGRAHYRALERRQVGAISRLVAE